MSTNSSDAWYLLCNRKIMLEILISCDFVDWFLQGVLQVSGPFLKGDSYHLYLTTARKGPLMRSSRRTTGQVAENGVVDDATDACSLRCIFATFLADSSASLGRPCFYRRRSKEGVSYHRRRHRRCQPPPPPRSRRTTAPVSQLF
jgi:hypothetical protein